MTIETGATTLTDAPRPQALPPEFERWHWGAFFLNWIWGIGNSTYVALLALMPFFVLPVLVLALGMSLHWLVYVGACLIMPVVLGRNGYRWAWRNGTWDSVAQFRRTQHNWSKWGIVVVLGTMTLGGLMFGGAFAMLRFSGAYTAAVEQLERSPDVATALGTPLTAGNFPMGSISVNGASGRAALAFPVSGPKGTGQVLLEARKDLSGWALVKLLLKVDGSNAVIDVLRENRV